METTDTQASREQLTVLLEQLKLSATVAGRNAEQMTGAHQAESRQYWTGHRDALNFWAARLAMLLDQDEET